MRVKTRNDFKLLKREGLPHQYSVKILYYIHSIDERVRTLPVIHDETTTLLHFHSTARLFNDFNLFIPLDSYPLCKASTLSQLLMLYQYCNRVYFAFAR